MLLDAGFDPEYLTTPWVTVLQFKKELATLQGDPSPLLGEMVSTGSAQLEPARTGCVVRNPLR